jgi:hypothetical protein
MEKLFISPSMLTWSKKMEKSSDWKEPSGISANKEKLKKKSNKQKNGSREQQMMSII